MKKVNRKRRSAEWKRAYGSEERVEWIKSQPSVASDERPCVNAHVRNGGAGRKADACWIVPLTDQEHKQLHQRGKPWFEAAWYIDLDRAAEITHARWLAAAGSPQTSTGD